MVYSLKNPIINHKSGIQNPLNAQRTAPNEIRNASIAERPHDQAVVFLMRQARNSNRSDRLGPDPDGKTAAMVGQGHAARRDFRKDFPLGP
jgi:hypothetical protein